MTDLFLDLLTRSLSASILVLIVVLLRFALKKAPKWMICALWVLVAIRLVVPFSIESAFSLIPEPISTGEVVDRITDDYWGNTHIYHDNTDEYQIAVDAGREPIHIGDGHYYVITDEDGISEPPTFENTVVPVISDIWITGIAIMAIYAAVSYLLVRRKVAASVCLRENIYLCDYIESPFILGILRPRIYLPSSLDQSQWPHVIAHEKAHLHRKDHWWKPLGFAILCVYWFNPVLWLAYVLLCKDIELACDERVIRDMDTQQKKDYTTALLECSMPRYLIAACPLAFGEVGVKERVKTVLNYKKPAFWIILIALVLCIAAAVCFLTDPMGESTITPGTYDFSGSLYYAEEFDGWNGDKCPHIYDGQYILHNNTLYYDGEDRIIAIGNMREYNLSNSELRSYLRNDDWWQTPFHYIPTINESLWLRLDEGGFYVWFQTNSGETYLACGIEDLGERYDAYSDDTHITQLCRLTRDETAEEMELAWFDATILEDRDTWLRVAPIAGFWEAEQYSQIEVSLWWHDTYTDISGREIAIDGILPGEFSAGDRVRIVYNGQFQETYPARISNTISVEKVGSVPPQYKSIEEAILDGCVAMVNGDAVAGQQRWQDFIILTEHGLSTSVRFVTYQTLSSPANYDPGDFPEVFQQYPLLYVYDLSYDGNQYILRAYGDGTERISEWPYLVHYSDVEYGPTYSDYYLLTNTPDLSWTDYTSSIAVSFTPVRSYPLYSDILYEDEPNQAELEIAKMALEPYMQEYKMSSLDANELTHRLDVSVYEWVDGLDNLIGQFMDLDFVTITHQKGTVEFTDQPTAATQFSATVLEITDGSILVEPLPGTVNHPGMDRLWVSRKLADSGETVQNIAVGNIVSILYDGMIAESYPGQINRVYDIQILPEHPDTPKEPVSQPEISIEVTNATATEGLIVYHINNLGDSEVMTGYDYHLEVLTEDGWVHYGYPPEELAWETAVLFRTGNHFPEDSQNEEIFVADWSRTAEAPLSPGTYRYCKNVMILHGDDIRAQSCYAVFEVPEDSPENPGIHMEILRPTEFGAVMAITYNGGLMGELSTGGQYYLMVNVGNDAMTKYGLVPSQVDWTDVSYSLKEGETLYLDVSWDYTADAPLPLGTYYAVLTVDQSVPYGGTNFHFTKYLTGEFAITD